jgi:hypothetical protein
MKLSRTIQFADHAIKFNIASPEILEAVDVHFAHCLGRKQAVLDEYQVEAGGEAGFFIQKNGELLFSNLTVDQVLFHLMQDGLSVLNGASASHLIFHAAGLALQERGVFLCGKSGSGKSTLTAWLLSLGFQYLSDEVMAVPFSGQLAQGFCRSLVLKQGSAIIWERWLARGRASGELLEMNDGTVWIPPTLLNPSAVRAQVEPQVIVFPVYSAEATFKVEPLRPAASLFMLMQCLVNARNFDGYGIQRVKELSQKISAYQLVYSDIEQAAAWIRQTITS